MTVSPTQTMMRLRLPSAIFAGHQVGAGLVQRRGDGDAVIDVVGPRLEVQVPGGDLVAEVLLLVLLDQAIADVADVDRVPVELAGAALEIGLHVVEQFVDLDGVGLEGDLVAVAEAEIDDGVLAGRLRLARLEAAPVADDLVEPFWR